MSKKFEDTKGLKIVNIQVQLLEMIQTEGGCPYIKNITTKANTNLGFVRRNMKNCTCKVKNFTYTSLPIPVVEYALQSRRYFLPFQTASLMWKISCAVYSFPSISEINEERFTLFCKSKNIQCHQLPPTKDALQKRILRRNFQAAVWKRACQSIFGLP